MRAEIDGDGRLTVIPESELERYALKSWLSDWPDKSVLEIQHKDPAKHANCTRRVLPQ